MSTIIPFPAYGPLLTHLNQCSIGSGFWNNKKVRKAAADHFANTTKSHLVIDMDVLYLLTNLNKELDLKRKTFKAVEANLRNALKGIVPVPLPTLATSTTITTTTPSASPTLNPRASLLTADTSHSSM